MTNPDECPIQNAVPVTTPFIDHWLEETVDDNVSVFSELNGSRQNLMGVLVRAVADHFRSVESIEESIKRLGFEQSLKTFRNSVPVDIKTRSGDLGEIICTEYVMQKTSFRVPIKKLRWKDDRDRTMRGNDVLGFRTLNKVKQVLKAESKSRAVLSNSVVVEAESGLLQHDGRPNPSSLAFLQNRLEEASRSQEADFIASLQETEFTVQNVRHLVFTLSGNPPKPYLDTKKAIPADPAIARTLVGVQIADHQSFIESVYRGCIDGSF